MGYPTLVYSVIGANPFMAYSSSSLRGNSACMEPSRSGSIIICVTGGLNGAPVHHVSSRLRNLNGKL